MCGTPVGCLAERFVRGRMRVGGSLALGQALSRPAYAGERVREITRRNRGHRAEDVIGELRGYVLGWLDYYKLSCTCTVIERLAEWVRRRVRSYYWKQWKVMSGGHS